MTLIRVQIAAIAMAPAPMRRTSLAKTPETTSLSDSPASPWFWLWIGSSTP